MKDVEVYGRSVHAINTLLQISTSGHDEAPEANHPKIFIHYSLPPVQTRTARLTRVPIHRAR